MTEPQIFADLRDNYNKYLQSPGTLIISKSLHEIYKSLNLEGFKEADESINVTKSEYGGPGESENESVCGPIREFIIKRDNQVFEFQPILNNNLEQKGKGFMDNFRASFNNKPNESVVCAHQDYIPNAPKKIKINPDSHSIFPRYRMIEETTIPNLDQETLFFIFYYQQDQYEKYLAACELKRKEWRFHKKYSVWFKRSSDPVVVNDEYEKGDMYVFDYEEFFRVKRRNGFQFEYKYLEDDLNPPMRQ